MKSPALATSAEAAAFSLTALRASAEEDVWAAIGLDAAGEPTGVPAVQWIDFSKTGKGPDERTRKKERADQTLRKRHSCRKREVSSTALTKQDMQLAALDGCTYA
eukprot:4389589-Pleurochrysis_carterae.AAC.1